MSAGLCRPRAYLNKTAYEILISCSLVCINTELEKVKPWDLGSFGGQLMQKTGIRRGVWRWGIRA